jgi:carboxypeptidase Taq
VFAGRTGEDFYKIVNNVTPSFIRTESDEVTYNMHVIIRFEIEKELIEGSIEVADVPKIWNDKMKSYLGVVVKKDSDGALQDVHWSGGMIGYFPTYTLGNLYSLQFWNKLQQDIPDAKKKIAKGEFKPILAWLRKHIHIHGKRYSASALVRQVTGEELTSAYFIDYLKEKYGKLYNLK